VDVQDSCAQLANEYVWSEYRADPTASDGEAVFMPGDHHEWAFQVHHTKLPPKAKAGKWRVYAVVRVEKSTQPASGTVFSAGVWDTARGVDLGSIAVQAAQAAETYKPYLIGTVEMGADRYIWVAPAKNPAVRGIWVDRLWLVAER